MVRKDVDLPKAPKGVRLAATMKMLAMAGIGAKIGQRCLIRVSEWRRRSEEEKEETKKTSVGECNKKGSQPKKDGHTVTPG